MELKIRATDLRWWFWAITLAFIVAALSGWTPAYFVVTGISAFQVIYFLVQEKSLVAFPTQIRIVYCGLTLSAFWPGGRFVVFALLLLGTILVTFFERCSIALLLQHMPWNRQREVRLN